MENLFTINEMFTANKIRLSKKYALNNNNNEDGSNNKKISQRMTKTVQEMLN